MSIVYQHPTPSSISNDNKITNINNTNINKKVKGPTILGMGSRSAFPPTMPNQVLCKQNQRAHMEWQRQQRDVTCNTLQFAVQDWCGRQ